MGSRKNGLLPRILGGDLEPGVSQILLTLGLAVTAQYAFWAFFAVWAVDELGMTKGDVGLAFLAAAAVGLTGGLVVFVAGEMLWSPAADAVAANLPPSEARGAVMGTMGIAMWIGGALAPAVGLRVAETGGDAA